MAANEGPGNYEETFETSTIGDMFKLPNRSRSRTSLSLFELVLDVVPAQKNEKSEYEQQLHKESCEWNTLLKAKIAEFEAAESTSVVIDKSVLTASQLTRLNHGPELAAKFAGEAAAFQEKAAAYLEEHTDLVGQFTEMINLCKGELDKNAFDIIYKSLYMKSRIQFS